MSKNDELCIKNEKLCIRNEKFCIKDDEFCSRSELEEQLKSNIREKLHEARHSVSIADKLDKLDQRQDALESNVAEIKDLLRRAIPGLEEEDQL